jgi:hypothetical protein
MTNLQRLIPLTSLLILLQLLLWTAVWFPTLADPDNSAQDVVGEDLALRLAQLTERADLVVRGQVVATTGVWRADGQIIESEITLEIRYALLGAAAGSLTLTTAGGYLPDEGLGMVASHAARFRTGEEVLLFLQRAGQRFVVVEEEVGKFSVQQGVAANGPLRVQVELAELYPMIGDGIARLGRHGAIPVNWATLEEDVALVYPGALDDFVFEGLRWPGDYPEIHFRANPFAPEAGGSDGSVADFLAALTDPAVTWSVVPGAAFTLIYDGPLSATTVERNGVNEVVFYAAGQSSVAGRSTVWFNQNQTIIEADFWLNADLDWDTTGQPGRSELDAESVALHEFGHWLGLGHDTDSDAVMYFSLPTGSLRRELHPSDIAGISYVYPCASEPCIPDIYAEPTATAASTESPTATATATPTPTMTPTLTAASTGTATTTSTSTPASDETPALRPTTTIAPTSISQPANLRTYLPMVQR